MLINDHDLFLQNVASVNIGTAVSQYFTSMPPMKISAVCVLLSLCLHCQSQELPYVRFMGNVLMNHSYVDLSLVGGSKSNNVSCLYNLGTCCSSAQGVNRGDWFFPNGTRLNFQNTGGDVEEIRGFQRVDLLRRNNRNVSGIYHCIITINHETMQISEFVYIGLYDMGGKLTNK